MGEVYPPPLQEAVHGSDGNSSGNGAPTCQFGIQPAVGAMESEMCPASRFEKLRARILVKEAIAKRAKLDTGT